MSSTTINDRCSGGMTNKSFPFFSLPVEIRDMILGYMLDNFESLRPDNWLLDVKSTYYRRGATAVFNRVGLKNVDHPVTHRIGLDIQRYILDHKIMAFKYWYELDLPLVADFASNIRHLYLSLDADAIGHLQGTWFNISANGKRMLERFESSLSRSTALRHVVFIMSCCNRNRPIRCYCLEQDNKQAASALFEQVYEPIFGTMQCLPYLLCIQWDIVYYGKHVGALVEVEQPEVPKPKIVYLHKRRNVEAET